MGIQLEGFMALVEVAAEEATVEMVEEEGMRMKHALVRCPELVAAEEATAETVAMVVMATTIIPLATPVAAVVADTVLTAGMEHL